MTTSSTATAATAPSMSSPDPDIKPVYLEVVTLIDRLHRRLLDVIKDEFDRLGHTDVNAVQALLLYNLGDSELTAGELRSRGFYQGSNVSYNLKKLVSKGYIHHERSNTDRRSVRVKLTPRGKAIADIVNSLYDRHTGSLVQICQIDESGFSSLGQSLKRLERFWTDQVLYRL